MGTYITEKRWIWEKLVSYLSLTFGEKASSLIQSIRNI